MTEKVYSFGKEDFGLLGVDKQTRLNDVDKAAGFDSPSFVSALEKHEIVSISTGERQ